MGATRMIWLICIFGKEVADVFFITIAMSNFERYFGTTISSTGIGPS